MIAPYKPKTNQGDMSSILVKLNNGICNYKQNKYIIILIYLKTRTGSCLVTECLVEYWLYKNNGVGDV